MRRPALQLVFAVMVLAVSLTLTPAPGLSAPITILNPGFESPSLNDGASSTTITDWQVGYYGGTFDPTTAYFNGAIPGGENVAYTYIGNSRVTQTLTATLQPNTLYTLSVYVGYNKISDPGAQYHVSLRAGSGVYPTVLVEDNFKHLIAIGDFALITVQYQSPGESSLIGQPLQIWLANASQGGCYVYFDDVSLTANSAVPLPGAVWFLGTGLLGLAGLRRFRKS